MIIQSTSGSAAGPDETSLTEQDERLTVLRFYRQQRFERIDRGGRVALREQLACEVQLIAVLVEDELAGEIAEPSFEP